MNSTRDEILKAIRSYVAENGYAPSVRELAAILGRGHSTVQAGLAELVSEGKISRTTGVARGLRVKR
jgi:DNA-binding GntR family transcriptional regulator